MSSSDPFAALAHYYDPIMGAVDYDRWYVVATEAARLLPEGPFRHLDAACGTGKLLKKLRRYGWNSLGVDLSHAMLRAGAKGGLPGVAAADMTALPFARVFDYVTCLFDSLNFLLSVEQLERSFAEVAAILRRPGIFYFDIITERMVTEHFEGQQWTENNGGFRTTWQSSFNRNTLVAETQIRIGRGTATIFRERVYSLAQIKGALENAGFTLLAAVDAENWQEPTPRSVRVDCIAVNQADRPTTKRFDRIRRQIQGLII